MTQSAQPAFSREATIDGISVQSAQEGMDAQEVSFPLCVVSLLVVQKPYVWLLHHHCMGLPNNSTFSLRFLKVLTPQQLEFFFPRSTSHGKRQMTLPEDGIPVTSEQSLT